MKKSLIISALALVLSMGNAAKAADCELRISVAGISEGENVPAAINNKIEAKLTNMLAQCGVTGDPSNGQFFMAARFDNAYFEVLTGADTKYVISTELTLYIGDYNNKQIFATETVPLKGVGISKERAYQACLNQLNPRNKQFRDFVEKGKEKIIDYFNKNYNTYLQQARTAMQSRKYDEALYYATAIPECCAGWDAAQSLVLEVYNHNVDYQGDLLLAQARSAWAASPDEKGAREAMSYIEQIDPGASCYQQAYALSNKIAKTTKENWDYEHKKKYEDALALEKERMRSANALERQRIAAARDVAVAYAKSRPKVVYNYRWLY